MHKGLKLRLAAARLPAGMLGASVALVLGLGSAAAHQQGPKLHLADVPADQWVKAITYCKGTYHVITKAGTPIDYREFDLRFKTDGSPDGPRPGAPVVIKAGMQIDRGFVIFADPSEISPFIRHSCN